MSYFLSLFITACFACTCYGMLTNDLNLISAQAIGKSGITAHAKSIHHCSELCKNHKQCDAANYHSESGKCRLYLRCTTYRLVKSSKHLHFAKRPSLEEKGFIYDDNSDSCLKVIDRMVNYQEADNICRNINGRLAALTKPEINKVATKLLKEAGVQYAWIGLTDNIEEGNPVHSSGDRVLDTGFFPKAKQGHRNDITRNCWSLRDSGEWAEQSCKDRKHYSICQIMPY